LIYFNVLVPGIDEGKLENIIHLEALEKVEKDSPMKSSPLKRSGSSSESPAKKTKLELNDTLPSSQ
jgi:hypothetical protein